jgi:hypothetical protein
MYDLDDTNRGIGRIQPEEPKYQRGANYFLGIGIDDYTPI